LFCHCQFRFLLAKCLKILMLCQLICWLLSFTVQLARSVLI
jgi:hypothetical protein